MNNKPVYTFHIDFETGKVLDEDFASFLDECFKKTDFDFDVAVSSKSGKGFVPLNMAINLFIKDCRKDRSERCIANPFVKTNFGDILKEFIEYYFNYYWNRMEMMNSGEYYQFDVFRGGLTCKALIPKKYISDDLYNEYRGLGPDYLMGARGMNNEVLFHHILPAFYFSLIFDDLEDDERYNKLHEYQIGLS